MKFHFLTILFLTLQISYSQELPTTPCKYEGYVKYSLDSYLKYTKRDSLNLIRLNEYNIKKLELPKNAQIEYNNSIKDFLNKKKITKENEELQSKFEIAVAELNIESNTKMKNLLFNRDEWVKYYRAKAEIKEKEKEIQIAEVEAHNLALEKETEKEAIEQKLKFEEETKLYPETYKSWKTEYISTINSTEQNVNVCKAIIKKHTFVNKFGQKRYDINTFTSQEKINYNKNYRQIREKLTKLLSLEEKQMANHNFYFAYINETTKSVNEKSMQFSTFYNSIYELF